MQGEAPEGTTTIGDKLESSVEGLGVVEEDEETLEETGR